MKHLEQASVSHEERLIEELRTDPEFAKAYLAAAMEEDVPVMLVALRQIAESQGRVRRKPSRRGRRIAAGTRRGHSLRV